MPLPEITVAVERIPLHTSPASDLGRLRPSCYFWHSGFCEW